MFELVSTCMLRNYLNHWSELSILDMLIGENGLYVGSQVHP